MTTCECPFHGRRRRHYDWCPLRASNRRAATPKCVECGLSQSARIHTDWQSRHDFHTFVAGNSWLPTASASATVPTVID